MQSIQMRFEKECKLRKPYSYGPYNVVRGNRQRIRITEGCVNNCSWCYEPTELKIFGIPKLERNIVEISDMNLLCKPQALQIIKDLGQQKVNGKIVEYELICGIDYRFLTQEIADNLHQSRFRKIRLAWDGTYYVQKKIKKALDMLLKAGYKRNEIMVFMIANYRIPIDECELKLDLCKVWGVQVCDCYYDGQVMPRVVPMFWSGEEIKRFRRKVRKHNQIVNFGIDPEVSD